MKKKWPKTAILGLFSAVFGIFEPKTSKIRHPSPIFSDRNSNEAFKGLDVTTNGAPWSRLGVGTLNVEPPGGMKWSTGG